MTNTKHTAAQPLDLDNLQFRKKPVIIEAFQFQRRNNGPAGQPDWFHDAVTRNDVILRNTGKWNDSTQPAYCEIKTLEGVMRANEGDWIIRGVKGELYPCRDDIFQATYEPARAAKPESATGTTGASVDTPEFQALVENWREQPYGTRSFLTAWDAIIAHIDAIIGDLRAQLAAKGQGAPVLYVRQMDLDRKFRRVLTLSDTDDDWIVPLYLSAPASAQPVDELDHGETVLRVQEALGITRTGWVSPDVIMLRIEQLQKASAQPDRGAAQGDGWREALEMCIKAMEHGGIGNATREAALQSARDALAAAPSTASQPAQSGPVVLERSGPLDANELERMAKAHPDECFLKGSGVLKLLGAIRALEQSAAPVAAVAPSTASQPVAPEAAHRIVAELSRISMSLAADLVQGADYTFQGHDYLDRDFVCERVMQWRAEWDATATARNELAEAARTAVAPSDATGKADLLDALQKAARLLRAAGFCMTGTATSQIVAAINAHADAANAGGLDTVPAIKYGMMKASYEAELAILRRRTDVRELVNRFLGWPLPDSLSARIAPNVTKPIGTHLMNADEAKAMFEYCFANQSTATSATDAKDAALEALKYVEQHTRVAGSTLMRFHKDRNEHWCGYLDDALNHVDYAQKRATEAIAAMAAAPSSEKGGDK